MAPIRIEAVEKMHELGQLIASVQERNGWSDRDLQDRAEARRITALSKSNFSRWRNAPVNSIKGSNIRDLSAVLGLPETTVAKAALASMGIDVDTGGSSSLDTSLAQDPTLSSRDKELVRALIGAMTTSEESDGRGNAAPMNVTAGDPGGGEPSDELVARRERGGESGGSVYELDERGVPIPPAGLAAYRIETEGMRQRAAIDEAGEESQAPPDDGRGA